MDIMLHKHFINFKLYICCFIVLYYKDFVKFKDFVKYWINLQLFTYWITLHLFCVILFFGFFCFSNPTFSKISFRNTIRAPNSLDLILIKTVCKDDQIISPLACKEHNMGLDTRKPVLRGCEQYRGRPASALAQSDQWLCYSLFEKYHMLTCYRWNINFLARLSSWGDWFETRFVGNPKDRFCRNEAHIEVFANKLLAIIWKKNNAEI